jgi:hypothetical protein
MPTQKHKKIKREPKYAVGDILRMDFGMFNNKDCSVVYYAIITRVGKSSYDYNYLDNWEDGTESHDFVDEHKGITLHA